MIGTVLKVNYLEDVALVTVNNIPNNTKNVYLILNEIAKRDISVDMISQTAPYKEKINLSFTVPQDNLSDLMAATTSFKSVSPEISTELNGNNVKFIISSESMRSSSGVAAKLFGALSDADIAVKLITTAETEISFLVDIKDAEKLKKLIK